MSVVENGGPGCPDRTTTRSRRSTPAPPGRHAARAFGMLALLAMAGGCGDDGTAPPIDQTLDPASLTASGPDGEPGKVTELVVQARDTDGAPFLGPLPGLALEIRGDNPGTVSDAANNGDGSYTLAYTPAEAGFDTLVATLDGDTIDGTPLASRVRVLWVAADGTATIDGVLDAGEWDGATEYEVFGGPVLSGSTARFMADGTNLYILITYPDSIGNAGVRFDNTLDLVLAGDDVIGGGATWFSDRVYDGSSFAPDSVSHGAAAGVVTASSGVIELSHPLDSGDPQDFDIDQATGVGICLGAGIGGLAADITEPGGCNLIIGQQRHYAELRLP
jgi:hypothetical protein